MPVRPNVTIAAAAILFVARFIILGLRLNEDVKRVLARANTHSKRPLLPKNFMANTSFRDTSFLQQQRKPSRCGIVLGL